MKWSTSRLQVSEHHIIYINVFYTNAMLHVAPSGEETSDTVWQYSFHGSSSSVLMSVTGLKPRKSSHA